MLKAKNKYFNKIQNSVFVTRQGRKPLKRDAKVETIKKRLINLITYIKIFYYTSQTWRCIITRGVELKLQKDLPQISKRDKQQTEN